MPARFKDQPQERHWKRLCRELRAMGLLTSADADAMEIYCDIAARYELATADVQKNGLTVDSPNGYPIINPSLSIVNKCIQQMHRLLAEFGMTPASRSRISVPEPEPVDPYEDFKRGKTASS